MGTWLRRLWYVLRRSRHEAELREEIETHRALRAAALERGGLPPRESADASRRAMGNVLLARDDAREAWLGAWDTWWQDVRYALRSFRRAPTFAAVAVLTLALGIGVNAGIFSVVNAVLFSELSAPRAHELVSVSQSVQGIRELQGQERFSTAEYLAYRDQVRTLSGLAAFGNVRGETRLGTDAPRLVLGMLVSCDFFTVMQAPPLLGRVLTARDCAPGAEVVIVLGYELWQAAFAGDPGVVGRTVQINREMVTVAGVATDAAATGPSFLRGGYLAPLTAGRRLAPGDTRYDDESSLWLSLIGRRRDGVPLEQVRAEFAVVATQIDRRRPGRSTVLTIERARAEVPPEMRRAATGAAAVLTSACGLILLIACANVANLLLARGASRTQEVGIRSSLGASRARIVRQLVTESLVLSVAGGLIGSAVAVWLFQTLITLAIPAMLPPWLPLLLVVDVSPDGRVLAFALALTLATGLLFGLAPALQASKADLHDLTKQGSAGGGLRAGRLRGTLVAVQVALCMVLMIAAGLLLRGLRATYTIDPGFEYRTVTYVSLETAFDGFSAAEIAVKRARLETDIEALPGVEAVAWTDQEPLGDDVAPIALRLPGESEQRARMGEVTTVTHRYFSLLGIPVVRGRAFTADEVRVAAPGARPAIVSATTARNLWPGADPIGRTVLWQNGSLQVVGVVADAQLNDLGRIDPYAVFVPGTGGSLLVKSRGDVRATAAGVRAAVRAFDRTLIAPVLPLEATLQWSRGISGTVTSLFGGLGVLALVLAAVGIYGVVAYVVTGRYREIGVRLALGATVTGVLGLLLRQTMRPVAIGAIAGLAAALVVSRVLSSVLFGVSPADPVGLGGAALLVLGVGLAAGLLAARPVAGGDPIAALRAE